MSTYYPDYYGTGKGSGLTGSYPFTPQSPMKTPLQQAGLNESDLYGVPTYDGHPYSKSKITRGAQNPDQNISPSGPMIHAGFNPASLNPLESLDQSIFGYSVMGSKGLNLQKTDPVNQSAQKNDFPKNTVPSQIVYDSPTGMYTNTNPIPSVGDLYSQIMAEHGNSTSYGQGANWSQSAIAEANRKRAELLSSYWNNANASILAYSQSAQGIAEANAKNAQFQQRKSAWESAHPELKERIKEWEAAHPGQSYYSYISSVASV